MTVYYNEFNKESAAMLEGLISDGIVADGHVDTRPIQEVKASELRGYKQHHFFAGIGGWSMALRLAGWSDDRPVWTGSCPCQPFSSAGRQKGKADDRHLWPVWFSLIREYCPATIFGEQVATAVAFGWLDDVYEGLEGEGYAVGAAVLPASSVGAPHKRDRLWFVADTERDRQQGQGEMGESKYSKENKKWEANKPLYVSSGSASNVANTIEQGLERHAQHVEGSVESRRKCTQSPGSAWSSGVWINCPDGKQRLVEPSIPLLADGFQHRKPILHALGNAIVPQVAAEFIKAATS